jgi:hypothetical protein
MDIRTKEELKRDGDYTPVYWQKLKEERGWLTTRHGQKAPKKHREPKAKATQ